MYSYAFVHEGVVTPCSPSGRWRFKSDVPERCAGYRVELDGELVFTHEDYEFLKNIENNNPYSEIQVVIYENHEEIWRGTFSIVTSRVSDYHGVYRVKPQVVDKYSVLLNDWERKHDILKQNIAKRDFAIVEESGFEFIEFSEVVNLYINNGFNYHSGDWYANNVLLPGGQFWNSFTSYKYLGFTTERNYYMAALYNDSALTSLYIRLIRTGNGAVYLPPHMLLQQWMWVKGTYTHLGGTSYRVTTTLARKVDITFDVAGAPVYPSDDSTLWDIAYSEPVTVNGLPGRKWFMKATAFQTKYNHNVFTYREGNTVVHYFELRNKKMIDVTPRYLKDVLAWFAKQYNLHKQKQVGNFIVDVIASELLTNATNPVTGESRNPLYYAVLVHNSEISGKLDDSKKGLKTGVMLSLKELLLSVCTNFNALWDIVDGHLTIEHITHWLDSASTHDLTTIDNGRYTSKYNNYEYDVDGIERKEVLQYTSQAEQMEFDGLPIEYAAYNVNKADGTVKETIESYSASIDKVLEEKSTSGLTLVLLEHVPEGILIFEIGTHWLLNPIIINTTLFKPIFRHGLLTGLWYINEPMTISRVMNDYHKHYRPLQLGKMNTYNEMFIESGYIKVQEDIHVPIDFQSINFLKKYKTELGWGRCFGFEFDSVSQIVKLLLKYQSHV